MQPHDEIPLSHHEAAVIATLEASLQRGELAFDAHAPAPRPAPWLYQVLGLILVGFGAFALADLRTWSAVTVPAVVETTLGVIALAVGSVLAVDAVRCAVVRRGRSAGWRIRTVWLRYGVRRAERRRSRRWC